MQSDTILHFRLGAFLSTQEGDVHCFVDPTGAVSVLSELEAAAAEVFAAPRTLSSGVLALRRRVGKQANEGPGEFLALVSGLLDKGVLNVGAPSRGSTAGGARQGMFGSPMMTLESAVAGDAADVVFVGMPYELGVTGGEGAKRGPGYLRRCTRSAFDYEVHKSVPVGWWDPKSRRQVLEGVRFCDIGDIACSGSHRNGVAFNRLHDAVKTLLLAKRLPVVVGGDHSISLASIAAASKVHPGLGVLHFDAHADTGSVADMGKWRSNCTHGNFMSWVLRDLEVSRLVQMGIRHLTPRAPYSSPKTTTFTMSDDLDSVERYLASLDKKMPYYVTFDVDCLDPQVVSQTGTPIPGGYSHKEATRLLKVIGERLHIVAADVVELAPRQIPDSQDGLLVGYLLFEFLASIFDGRYRGAVLSK